MQKSILVFIILICQSFAQSKPNIVWIYVEDLSPWMPLYGDKTITTPTLDEMASKGVLFTNAFTPAPVCSATRSALITGMMQTTWNMHNHRSSRFNGKAPSRDDKSYTFIPKGKKTLPEYFKNAGYSTFNVGKDDYNFVFFKKDLYENITGKATNESVYKKLKKNQPFFCQLQLRGGKLSIKNKAKLKAEDMQVPPYFPDTKEFKQSILHHYNTIKETDKEVKKILTSLKKNKLLDNTIVVFFSDHGMDGIRHKQFCYDGGLHVPMIIRWYGNEENLPKEIRDELMPVLNLSATTLALANIDVPSHMESKDIFAKDYKKAEYVISARDRCDYTIDRVRTVRSKKYRYIRNYYPNKSHLEPNYRDISPSKFPELKKIRSLYKQGKLNEIQKALVSPTREEEEFYDIEKDPHQINNLAKNKEYQEELKKHRKILEDWIKETGDKGQLKENKESLKRIYKRWKKLAVDEDFNQFK